MKSCCTYSKADAQNLKNAGLARRDQGLDTSVQSLGQSTEKIQSDNHKVFVGSGDVLRVLGVHLGLHQVGVNDLDAALENWGGERQETLAEGSGDRGQALEI